MTIIEDVWNKPGNNKTETLNNEWQGETHFTYYPEGIPPEVLRSAETFNKTTTDPEGTTTSENAPRDHWEVSGDFVIRHHSFPRKTMLDLRSVKDCPVITSKLGRKRILTI